MPPEDPIKRRAYQKKYHDAHRERRRENNRKSMASHPEYYRKWKEDNAERIRKLYREWLKNNRAKMQNYYNKFKKKFPERIKAVSAVTNAIQSGKLTRPIFCQECEKQGKIQAHHYLGYQKKHWLDVQWLCLSCHKRKHRHVA